MSPRLASFIGWSTTLLFIASSIADAVPDFDYTPPPYLGPAFLIVAGAAFADRGIRRAIQAFGNGRKEPDEGP